MAVDRTVPDFFYAGTAKCGTTSIYEALKEHPQVFMPDRKLLDYFSDRYDEDREWYLSHFEDAHPHQVVGEASPYIHQADVAAKRMHAHAPEAKLVFSVRDPVDRAYSEFRHDRQRGRWEDIWDKSFAEVLETPRGAFYLEKGQYIEPLETFLEYYDREDVHLIVFEEFADAFHEAMSDVFRFLDVPQADIEEASTNPTREPRTRFHTLAMWLLRHKLGVLRGPLDPGSIPETAKRILRPILYRGEGYPPMDDDLRRCLEEHYAPYNRRLADRFDLDLPWSTPDEVA